MNRRNSPTYRHRVRCADMAVESWLLDEADEPIGPFRTIADCEEWVRANGGGYVEIEDVVTTLQPAVPDPSQGLLFRYFHGAGLGFVYFNDEKRRQAFNDGRAVAS